MPPARPDMSSRPHSSGNARSVALLLGLLVLCVLAMVACGGSGESDSEGDGKEEGQGQTSSTTPSSDGDQGDADGEDAEDADSDEADPDGNSDSTEPFSIDNWPDEPVIASGDPAGDADDGTPGTQLGPIPVPETSALVASRLEDDVYWTIQDRSPEDDRAALHGFRLVDGEVDPNYGGPGKIRTVMVRDVANVDWETLSHGPDGTLLIGDLGNNDCRRNDQKVLQVREPEADDLAVDLVARWQVDFPDTAAACGGKNSEASTIFDGVYTILAKTEPPLLYQLDDPVDGQNTLTRLGPIAQPAGGFARLTTGMAINDAGDRVAVTTAGKRFWVYDIDGPLLESLATSPPRWSRRYTSTPDTQIEGVSFLPGTDDLLLIGENRSLWYWPAESYEEGELG